MEESEIESAATGVQQLVDRIRQDGVHSGQEEAARIVREAEQKAANLVAKAKAQAAQELEQAREKIESESRSAEEALKLAARDTIKELGSGVRHAFERQLERIVGEQLDDPELLREIIVALAGQTARDTIRDRAVEIVVDEKVVGHQVSIDSENEDAEKRLRQLILEVSGRTLREGIEFRLEPRSESGVSIRMVEEELEVDLDEKTISAFLLRHLLPRYRRLLSEGQQ